MNKKKKILLTGASGTVGFQVLTQLYQQKEFYEIVVLDVKNRRTQKKFKRFKNDITIHYGSITDAETLNRLCTHVDVVIHLAAIIPPLADENPQMAHQVNVVGTTNLIQALEKHSPRAFLLYSSSISVYGDRLKNPYIYVQDPLKPSQGDEYAITKIQSEEAIKKSKLDWSIFRLGAIMGGHKISKLMFHQPLKTSMEIATPEDTARAFVHAIQQQNHLSKQIFNLGGGEHCRISYEDFLIRSFKLFGLGKLNFPVNTFAEHNFHCGFYADGDQLEKVLHFRQNTLEDYFRRQKKGVPRIQKAITYLLKKPIKYYLQKQSEPLLAIKTQNQESIKLFFNH